MTRFITLIPCILLISTAAFAQDSYRQFGAGRFDYHLSADVFNSSANFDSNGGKQNLITNASVRSIGTATSVRYLFWDRLGIYTGLFFNNFESNNGITTRTNSLLTYYQAGLDFQFFRKNNWSLFLDGNFKYANEQIDANGDSALASDGANEIAAQVNGVYDNGSLRFFGRLGGTYREQGLSQLLKYGVGTDYAFADFRLGLEIEGLSTISNDENTSTPINRDLLTTRVNAGSRAYYSINPNQTVAKIYAGYSYEKDFNIKIFAGSTVIGSNSAQGVVGGLAFNWGFGITKTPPRYDGADNDGQKPDPGFKVDTNDGVNQDLFKNTPPTPPKQ